MESAFECRKCRRRFAFWSECETHATETAGIHGWFVDLSRLAALTPSPRPSPSPEPDTQ